MSLSYTDPSGQPYVTKEVIEDLEARVIDLRNALKSFRRSCPSSLSRTKGELYNHLGTMSVNLESLRGEAALVINHLGLL
jgi:hypothetical protein